MRKKAKIGYLAVLAVVVILSLLVAFVRVSVALADAERELEANKQEFKELVKKLEKPEKKNPKPNKPKEKTEVKPKPKKAQRKVVVKRSAESVPKGRTAAFTVTGYSTSVAEGTADGITADGTRVRHGVCAADISRYPFGTRFYIPNYGECVVHDTGSAIVGNRIDAYFPSREAAFQWGVRRLNVRVY